MHNNALTFTLTAMQLCQLALNGVSEMLAAPAKLHAVVSAAVDGNTVLQLCLQLQQWLAELLQSCDAAAARAAATAAALQLVTPAAPVTASTITLFRYSGHSRAADAAADSERRLRSAAAAASAMQMCQTRLQLKVQSIRKYSKAVRYTHTAHTDSVHWCKSVCVQRLRGLCMQMML
jgi:hypothetical protein